MKLNTISEAKLTAAQYKKIYQLNSLLRDIRIAHNKYYNIDEQELDNILDKSIDNLQRVIDNVLPSQDYAKLKRQLSKQKILDTKEIGAQLTKLVKEHPRLIKVSPKKIFITKTDGRTETADLDTITSEHIQEWKNVFASPAYTDLINDYDRLIEVITSYCYNVKIKKFIDFAYLFDHLKKNACFAPYIREYKDGKFHMIYCSGKHTYLTTPPRGVNWDYFTVEQIAEIFEMDEMIDYLVQLGLIAKRLQHSLLIQIIGPVGTEYVNFKPTFNLSGSSGTPIITSSEIEKPGDLYRILQKQL